MLESWVIVREGEEQVRESDHRVVWRVALSLALAFTSRCERLSRALTCAHLKVKLTPGFTRGGGSCPVSPVTLRQPLTLFPEFSKASQWVWSGSRTLGKAWPTLTRLTRYKSWNNPRSPALQGYTLRCIIELPKLVRTKCSPGLWPSLLWTS